MKKLEQNRINLIGRTVFLSLFFLIVLSFSNKNLTVDNTSKHFCITELSTNNPKVAVAASAVIIPQIHYCYISSINNSIYFSTSFKSKLNSNNQQFNICYKHQRTHIKLIKPLISCQFLTQKLPFVSDEIPILG